MTVTRSRFRSSITRDVGVLCLIIFMADVTSGIVSPTFSLFAQSIGVSLALLGLLSTAGGLTQLLTSLPIGVISDQIGRPRVLLTGVLVFALSLSVMASAHGLPLLLLSRVLMGAAIVGTFQIGAAHLGDITEPAQRPVAFGLYTTAMGSGFTIGPLLGSFVSQFASVRLAYGLGAGLSLCAALLAWRIHRRHQRPVTRSNRVASLVNIRSIASQPDLVIIAGGNVLINLVFAGAITTYFPIYAESVSLTQAAIGIMFSVRALVSTLGRLPNGLISRYLGNRIVMMAAIGLDLAVMFGIAHTTDARWLTVLVALEGLSFGAYLVSGQTYIADRTEMANRGTAVGLYSTAGSLGGTIGPLTLGIVAGFGGLSAVFSVTGWTLAVGLALSVGGTLVVGSRERVAQDADATS